MFSYISCGHGCFFLIYGTRPNTTPLTCHWGPCRYRWLSDNRWLMRFVGEAREESAKRPSQGRHFNFFLGAKIFLYFQCHRTNWKKQHFICSNLTLFIVPFFFLSFFLFSFSFFFFSFFFFFFFLFSVYLRGGDGPQLPINDASGPSIKGEAKDE